MYRTYSIFRLLLNFLTLLAFGPPGGRTESLSIMCSQTVCLPDGSHHLPASCERGYLAELSWNQSSATPPSGLQSCVFGCAHTRTHNTRAHTHTLQGRLAIRKSVQLVALEARPPARGAQCSFSLSRGVCSALRTPEPGQGYEWRKTFQRLEGIPMQPAPFFQLARAQWSFQDGKAGRERRRRVEPAWTHGRGVREVPGTSLANPGSPVRTLHSTLCLEILLRGQTVLKLWLGARQVQGQKPGSVQILPGCIV